MPEVEAEERVTMELTKREAEVIRRMRMTPAERRAWLEQLRAETRARVETRRAQKAALPTDLPEPKEGET